jgi:hypothetical protein
MIEWPAKWLSHAMLVSSHGIGRLTRGRSSRMRAHGLPPTGDSVGRTRRAHPWLGGLTGWLVQVMDQWVHCLGWWIAYVCMYIYRHTHVAGYNPFHESKNSNQIWWKSLIRFKSDLWKPTLQFPKLKPSFLQPGVSSKYHNFLIRASNHVFHISILIVSTRASELRFEFIFLSFEALLCFLSEIEPNYSRNRYITWKTCLYGLTCEIYKVGLQLKILTIL